MPRPATKPECKLTRPRGQKTRHSILRRAANLASVEGLEGLTIGSLAAALKISKSGLFAHFGSKEQLQCAVVDEARDIFIEAVIEPALDATGLKRLQQLCENWISYAEKKVFPGGCFFSAASLEFDDRPGIVRDRIVALMKQWLGMLEQTVREAQAAGELQSDVDPHLFAFEMNALFMGGNWSTRLFKDPAGLRAARLAVVRRIQQITISPSRSNRATNSTSRSSTA